jgi:UDP-N-acetyl-D-glucosamine dehydrogenase
LGNSYVQVIPGTEFGELPIQFRLRANSVFPAIAGLKTVNICVPAPLRKSKYPEMSYIVRWNAKLPRLAG